MTSTPLEPNHQLAKTFGPFFATPDRYRRLITKLIYLTLTRLELAYLVHILAQFMQKPQTAHWAVVFYIVRYLKVVPIAMFYFIPILLCR